MIEATEKHRRLHSMDVVLYEGALWVVSGFRKDTHDRQLVNLSEYNGFSYRKNVPSFRCKIVYDWYNRKRVKRGRLTFYPQTDF